MDIGHSAIWDNYSSNNLALQITDNCKLQFALFALQLLANVGFVDNQPLPPEDSEGAEIMSSFKSGWLGWLWFTNL